MMGSLKSLPIDQGTFVHYVECNGSPVLVSKKPSGQQVLLDGKVVYYHSPNAWLVHGGVTTEHIDFQALKTVSKSVLITLLLHGKLDFGYDNQEFNLNVSEQPIGVIVNIKHLASFKRTLHKGNLVRKLNVLLPSQWLEERSDEQGNIQGFLSQHLNVFMPMLTTQILESAEKIIEFGTPKGLQQKLEFETLTHQLLLPLIDQLSQCRGRENERVFSIQPVYPSSTDRKLERVIGFIDNHLDQEFSVEFLAKYIGMSSSSLQRKFKALVGYNVQRYTRLRRLELARQHLEKGRMTVTEAAYSAGYRHPANFTNAFKKAFGCAPTMCTLEARHKP
jgi:AraC-like DNA-binding protein